MFEIVVFEERYIGELVRKDCHENARIWACTLISSAIMDVVQL